MIDLTTLSDDELLALRQLLGQEIQNRNDAVNLVRNEEHRRQTTITPAPPADEPALLSLEALLPAVPAQVDVILAERALESSPPVIAPPNG